MTTPRTWCYVPWQGRLVVLAAIWGLSFLFIKVSDEGLAPLQVTLARMVLGTTVLLVILAIRGEGLPRAPRTWAHLAVAALLLNAVPFTLFAYGETRTTSVLAGIWNATTPLVAFPVAMLMLRDERPTRDRAIGLVIGFAGVLVILGVWEGFTGDALLGNLACLAAAASYGVGFPYARKYLTSSSASPLAMAASQLACGTVAVALLTPFVTTAPGVLPLPVLGSVVMLGVFGTGLAYLLNYSVIRNAGATIASTVTYLIPLFSTLVGVVVLGESLTWYEPVGAVIVILGVAVTQGRISLPPRPRAVVAGIDRSPR